MTFQAAAESWDEVRAVAAQEERERLGGLLHDGVLQSLNVAALELAHLKLDLMAAADLGVTFPALPFAAMLQTSDALERQMRLAVGDLRGWFRQANDLPPTSFAAARQPDSSLPGALRWLVLQRLRFPLEEEHPPAGGGPPAESQRWVGDRRSPREETPSVRLRVLSEAIVLSATVEAEVLAIVQEALLNAHRHGRAREIQVTVDLEIGATVLKGTVAEPTATPAAALKLVVLDDGQASPKPCTSPTDGASRGGFGLRAMHGRAARLGATLTVAPAPFAGTRVCLEIPLQSSADIIEI